MGTVTVFSSGASSSSAEATAVVSISSSLSISGAAAAATTTGLAIASSFPSGFNSYCSIITNNLFSTLPNGSASSASQDAR